MISGISLTDLTLTVKLSKAVASFVSPRYIRSTTLTVTVSSPYQLAGPR